VSISYFAGYTLISRSGLFDPEFYFATNPDVDRRYWDPVAHYLEIGAGLGRNPSADFDTAHYVEQCAALGEAPENPLIHYLQVGAALGLRINPSATPAITGPAIDTLYMDSLVLSRGPDGRGILKGAGWLAASHPVAELSVRIGDDLVGYATYGLSRPDVAATHPDFPGVMDCGFAFSITRLPEGLGRSSDLVLAARLASGEDISGRFPFVLPDGLTDLGRPTVDTEDARFAARMKSDDLPPIRIQIDEALASDEGVITISGWAIGLAPMVSIDVWLDDERLGGAEFGARRDDVAKTYPDYVNAALSGFKFVSDGRNLGEGKKTFLVRCAIQGGLTREMAVPLILRPPPKPPAAAGASDALVHCDDFHLTTDGRLRVQGWAICSQGVEAVMVFLDGVLIGETQVGLERADVGNAYPKVPGARKSGFNFSGAAAEGVTGEHILSVRVRTPHGRAGGVRIPIVAVEAAASPTAEAGAADDFGINLWIDSPAIADGAATKSVRSSMTIAGWAVAGRGIEEIAVGIDGHRVATAYYGIRRDDVAAALPNIPNSLLSGFAALLPNRVLPLGAHVVNLIARDKAGGELKVDFKVQIDEFDQELPGPWSLRKRVSQSEIDLRMAGIKASHWRPSFSLLLLVSATDEGILAARNTLQSLRDQAYDDWRLLIRPSGSDSDINRVRRRLLDGFEDMRDRITWTRKNGAKRSLDQIFAPSAERDSTVFCGLLTGGDELGADALLAFAAWTALNQATDLVYCDERRLNPGTGKLDAFFKPDWSPDLALSSNYLGRLWFATASLLRETGVTLLDLATLGEYDLVLKCAERAKSIGHVPAVLVERPPSAGEDPSLERAALESALARRGIGGRVVEGCAPGIYDIERAHTIKGLVSIIIPTCAAKGYIKTCIDTMRERTSYRNFEIVCIENIPAALMDWRVWLKANADEVLTTEEPFNWSRFNNLAAARSRGEYLVFLNDDIEIISPNWLDVLLSHMARPEVGIAGPLLLYPDRTIQHAGLFLSHMGLARHAFRFAPEDDPNYFGLALSERNLLAITGACMMVRRDTYDLVGGFDETHTVINNDVDFCLRVHERGFLVVYTPRTKLIHHELASRSEITDHYDSEAFDDRWGDMFLRGDPYYNINLSKDQDNYSPEREPLRVVYANAPLIARKAVKTLLLVKVDHIGDCVTALPAVRRLREFFPDARLCVLAMPSTRSIWSLVEGIDEVIPFQFFHTRSGEGQVDKTEEELAELRDRLAPYRFDLAIDLRKSPDTRHLLPYSGARFYAGFNHHNDFPWLDITLEWEGDTINEPKHSHISDDLVRLVQAVELACEPDRTVLTRPKGPTPLAASLARHLYARPVVAIHPAAGNALREWPAASFAQFIDLLTSDFDVNVAIIGGPGDQGVVDNIMARVRRHDRVTSLLGALSLGQLSDFLPSCVLFVGNNSGPSHLSAALGVPTVAVHSGVIASEEWGPQGPAGVAVRRELTCAPCYIAMVDQCHRHLECVVRLTAGEVLNVCRPLLALGLATADEAPKEAAQAPAHA
jgi:ADP-heptose:LPS heptosyltransferase/GT2 family glycosyltransferase